MEFLNNIQEHLAKMGRNIHITDRKTIQFQDQISLENDGDKLSQTIFISEASPKQIVAYTNLFEEVKGDPDNLLKFSDDLLERNAFLSGICYAKTPDGVTILKGDFQATDNDEESLRRFDDMWVNIRDEVQCIGEHLKFFNDNDLTI